ncbi:hypothetical protein AVEN_38240-1 [Araneus ventricosus]|uniref:DUF7041 domain-containing protein n=1 Tax=Araneus ventricosus TaxID=182803 RepID=A0A4Y2AY87_ARAVE|nr:hypothetical protein AVEN_38240-1 [Araneus ventricosus]
MPNSADIRLSESSNSSTDVSAVAIKTPAFWSDKPELRFAQLESQFALGNISVDSTKFYYVIAALNSDDLTCVSDLVLNPPQTDSYNSLKTRLIAQNADSESVRLKKLLSGMELGDKKPSTLLYAMKSLASDGISPELLKSLWMQRLPIQIQQILSVSGDNLQALSKMADIIFEISKDDLVASVSDNFQSPDVNKFENRLAAIENRLSRLEVRRRSLSRGNSEITGREFLVDTGSAVSVLPILGSKIVPSKFVLYAAKGTKINTFGTKLITLNLGLKRKFQWPFILASVSKPILGADFLEHYSLLVDMKRKKLLDGTSAVGLEKPISANESMYVATVQGDFPYVKLLLKFSDITKSSQPKPAFHVKHNTEHHIETRGPPVFSKARRLDPEKLQAAKREFQYMVSQGWCRPSKSAWASPLHMVPKKDDWRPCGDYRRLNNQTIPHRFPIPHVHDFAHNHFNKKILQLLILSERTIRYPLQLLMFQRQQ